MPGHHPPPPHEHPPPHEKHGLGGKNTNLNGIIAGLILATIVAFCLGYVMSLYGISVNVILPVLAPIWVGILTLTYMHMNQK